MNTAASAASEERRARILELTQQGMTTAEIADAMGLARRSVTRLRTKHQPPQQHAGRLTAPRLTVDELAWARDMLEDGAPYTEVAETLGRSRAALRRRLPGYQWTKTQIGEYAIMMSRLARPLGLSGARPRI